MIGEFTVKECPRAQAGKLASMSWRAQCTVIASFSVGGLSVRGRRPGDYGRLHPCYSSQPCSFAAAAGGGDKQQLSPPPPAAAELSASRGTIGPRAVAGSEGSACHCIECRRQSWTAWRVGTSSAAP
ncbi:hypothetical protein PLESTB_000944500 [Pleodorina starrii]|uniref:Uncharacterized protein n=1 Tax=Pleodorina starrii TaxID=330485 RepID=A0A9W6F3I6_9CHLO|nr:hypothetical protein PLESTM_001154200 [Pleodorina starrii]GLC55107.1 hypothetical protein PLESTB_000944500 [Pleodorina starrii]GLC71139.1 hypothetical protein PLESTF_001078700 [Pleodorina starrii]